MKDWWGEEEKGDVCGNLMYVLLCFLPITGIVAALALLTMLGALVIKALTKGTL